MKRLFLLAILIVCFSCDKKENETDMLFKNHLKETLEIYQNQTSFADLKLQQKEAELDRKIEGSEQLRTIGTKFKKEFEKTKITDKSALLELQSKLYAEFNQLYPYRVKYISNKTDRVTDLNFDILKLYIECNFYKTQYENFEFQGSDRVIVCSIPTITDTEWKEIQVLQKQIQEIVKKRREQKIMSGK